MNFRKKLSAAIALSCVCSNVLTGLVPLTASAADVSANAGISALQPNLADVNEDGSVDSDDAMILIRYAVGLVDESDFPNIAAGDVNGDGIVNIADATTVGAYVAGAFGYGEGEDVSIYSEEISVLPGDKFQLNVMIDAGRISAFQMDVNLYGLEYRDINNDWAMPTVNDRDAASGELRVALAVSDYIDSLMDSDEALFYLEMVAPEECGIYSIGLENCVFSGPNGDPVNYTLNLGDIIVTEDIVTTAPPVLLGDANDDGYINELDVEAIQQYISGDTDAISSENGLNNADLDRDGTISESDITILEDLIESNKTTTTIETTTTAQEEPHETEPTTENPNRLMGDVTDDGIVDEADLEALVGFLIEDPDVSLTRNGMANADMDGDGELTAEDAEILREQLTVNTTTTEATTTVTTETTTITTETTTTETTTTTTTTTETTTTTTATETTTTTTTTETTTTTTTTETTTTTTTTETTTTTTTTETATTTTTTETTTTTTTAEATTTTTEATTAAETTTATTEPAAVNVPVDVTAAADAEQDVNDAGELEITAEGLYAVLDADAVSIIREQAEQGIVLLSLETVNEEKPLETATPALEKAVQEILTNGGTAFDLTLVDQSGESVSFSDGETGSISITVPYTANSDDAEVKVYYIDENGEKTDMNGTYNAENHTVTFKTTHFSLYAIQEELPQTGNLAFGSAAAVLAAVMLMLTGTCAVFGSGVIRKRREEH